MPANALLINTSYDLKFLLMGRLISECLRLKFEKLNPKERFQNEEGAEKWDASGGFGMATQRRRQRLFTETEENAAFCRLGCSRLQARQNAPFHLLKRRRFA